jgi:hypothetical protein
MQKEKERMRKAQVVALGLLVAVLAAPALRATTAVERSDADLIQESAIIVTGHCTHLQSQWAGRTLVTLATIQISEVLKGSAGATVTVTLPGGVDSNRRIPIAMNYPAAPVILQQEDVLLFLTPQELVAGSYSVVGYSQGKFTLVADARGRKMATQSLSGLKLQGKNGSLHESSGKTIQLDELRAKIQSSTARR